MNSSEPLGDRGLADTVAEQLRTAIWSGEFAPGDRLVERRLARRYGVSHIPLREALARLVEEGLVVRLPRRGARVASLSTRTLEEISSLRVVLEQFVVRRVTGRITAKDRRDLQRTVDRMRAAAERYDLAEVNERDQQFHEQLWRLADHTLLLELAAQMRSRTNHFFRAAATSLGPTAAVQHAESHQRLLDVIASGDRRAAERAMRNHVEAATRRIAAYGLADEPGEEGARG